jgi:uncharacterized protein
LCSVSDLHLRWVVLGFWDMLYFRTLSFFAIVMAAAFLAVPSHAASFPCSRARSCTEQVICQTPELSHMDDRMAAMYFSFQSQSSRRGATALLQSQRSWLASRDSCVCNASCLMDHYAARIDLFENVLNPN